MSLPVFLGLMDPLYNLFGMIMAALYSWLRNYGLVIIVIDVVLRLLIMPLSFKSSKNMAKQQFLQDDLNEIKRVYANDKQKAYEAQTELMRQSGVSMGSGCFSALLPMLFLFAIWRPIQQPLYYIAGISAENLNHMATALVSKGLMTEQAASTIMRADSPLLTVLSNNGAALSEFVDKGWIQLNQLLDFRFLGMDLGKIPSLSPSKIFGAETRALYLPLFILVIVMITTMMITTWMSKLNMPRQQSKEEKEREKANPAKSGQTQQQSQAMLKTMQYVFPVMMLWMAFTLPAAMALFWTVSNLMAILQTWLTYRLYTQPLQAAADEKKAASLVSRRRNKSNETIS